MDEGIELPECSEEDGIFALFICMIFLFLCLSIFELFM